MLLGRGCTENPLKEIYTLFFKNASTFAIQQRWIIKSTKGPKDQVRQEVDNKDYNREKWRTRNQERSEVSQI